MEYRILSEKLRPVSRLALGSLTVSKMQSALPLDEAADVLAYGFERGINFVDTAQYYENYDILRLALKRAKNGSEVMVSTKTYAYSRSLAEAAVEEARRSLDRDVIDLFMLHEQESYNTLRGHMEALEYLFECRERGIIRAVGASTHHVSLVHGLMRLMDEGFSPDVCHPLYNMRGIGIADGGEAEMREALTMAHDRGIGIFGMKALGGGHLSCTPEEALKFVFDKPFMDAVAVGMQSREEIDANIRFFETGSFSDSDRDSLSKKHRSLHVEEYCEGCGSCVKRCGSGALSLVEAEDEEGSAYDFTSDFGAPNKAGKRMRAVADDSKCVRCGYCTAVCPVFALKIY